MIVDDSLSWGRARRLVLLFALEQPHLVGMDIGCDAALFAAALHPVRFRSLVVGSGGTVFPLQLGGRLKEWVEAPDLEAYRRSTVTKSSWAR